MGKIIVYFKCQFNEIKNLINTSRCGQQDAHESLINILDHIKSIFSPFSTMQCGINRLHVLIHTVNLIYRMLESITFKVLLAVH